MYFPVGVQSEQLSELAGHVCPLLISQPLAATTWSLYSNLTASAIGASYFFFISEHPSVSERWISESA